MNSKKPNNRKRCHGLLPATYVIEGEAVSTKLAEAATLRQLQARLGQIKTFPIPRSTNEPNWILES
jgi:hypothetical protein